MNNQIKALMSWILALGFLCLMVTGFAIWLHWELFGLRVGTLKNIHVYVAILCMVAALGHLYYNLDTLCKYVWIRRKGPNMLGTFLIALAITVIVVVISGMRQCDNRGRGRGGERRYQDENLHSGKGQGQGRGQGGPGLHQGQRGPGDGLGRGQGGPGRGLGPGGGKGLRRGFGSEESGYPPSENQDTTTKTKTENP